ncbi:TIR domain [Mactra antiquata]
MMLEPHKVSGIIVTLIVFHLSCNNKVSNALAVNINNNKCVYNKQNVLRISDPDLESAEICVRRYQNATHLYYTNSNLKKVPSFINFLRDLVFLDLSENDISDANLSTLDFHICSKLIEVDFGYNNISVLKKSDFNCLRRIQAMHIRKNSLETIENGTFTKIMSELTHINLEYNKLTVIDTSLVSRIKLGKMMHLHVNVSWNNINTLTNSYNITIKDFNKTISVGIDLVHNNFTTIDINLLLQLFNVTKWYQLLNLFNCGFDLRFNPFICDCRNYDLAKYLREFHDMDRDNPVFSITCGSPRTLYGKLIRAVDLIDFNCTVTEDCPPDCHCILTINLTLITVHCGVTYKMTELPEITPGAKELIIDMKTEALVTLSPRPYLDNVSTLDVSGCGIAEIDPRIEDQLAKIPTIYLHDNKIQYLPTLFSSYTLKGDHKLTLYGNQFVCDCNTLWLKRWVEKNYEHFIHGDKILCATGPGLGESIIEVPDSEFICSSHLSLYIIIGISAGCLATSVFIIVAVIHYKTHIQVWFIANFDVCKYCCRKPFRNDFKYDVFVSYSYDDSSDVDKIVEFLEKQSPPYKLCKADREFVVGKSIVDNIFNAIKSSHTTLLIVSNNFLRSQFCNMEFREAHLRFLKNRDINLILVKLDDLDQCLIKNELEAYMKRYVYIDYRDKQFYAKLLVALPYNEKRPSSESSPLIPKQVNS